MASVSVKIAGRSYTLSCGPGEEARVRELAGQLDREATDISGKVGHVSESRLLLMSALSALDRHTESVSETGSQGKPDGQQDKSATEAALALVAEQEMLTAHSAQLVHDLADRLENIAAGHKND